MGILKLENLPKEAVPLTRSADIKLVLDTPKGMFCVFLVLFPLCFSCPSVMSSVNASEERAWEARRGRFWYVRGIEEMHITEVHPRWILQVFYNVGFYGLNTPLVFVFASSFCTAWMVSNPQKADL